MLSSRARPRTLLLIAFASVTTYWILFSGSGPQFHVVPFTHDSTAGQQFTPSGQQSTKGDASDAGPSEKHAWDISIEDIKGWRDPDDDEDPADIEPGYERDGKHREPGDISKTQHEKDLRTLWRYAYKTTKDLASSDLIYGNTLETIDYRENRTEEAASRLREDPDVDVTFTEEHPVRFNPFPDYNSDAWKASKRAPYVPCYGATGELVEDLLVFKGTPQDFPAPKLGSYDKLGLDENLCWERETRLGPYGFTKQMKKVGGEFVPVDWDNVNWGDLQRRCVHKNAKRYDLNKSRKNPYLNAYSETAKSDDKIVARDSSSLQTEAEVPEVNGRALADFDDADDTADDNDVVPEKRTAVLLRAYTGKDYTENDKQFIRAMVNELSLKSGGEYEVFLLVHVKDKELRIFNDPETYQAVLHDNVPPEFHGMTVLWNDEVVWNIYTELKDEQERSVHTAQWLSVQKFSHDHPQFDFIWNWEMDFRFTGHHYDILNRLSDFSAAQPRKGLWERNERWYIPEYHGDYDTTFRQDIEERYGNDTVWGPLDLSFINPVGPKPPVKSPSDDNYEWGVGEDADVITLGPIFNPINSNWIISKHVWGYTDANHHSWDVPRRTTIVTHSRVSKRLLDIMHVENMRGNHVASEMTPQTVALHHGFKAVFAPHPIFMDRDWDGEFLNKWFNPGEKGESGGYGSPMGWGRERRYQGTTWYYRAEPPNRLFNNWMGWVDTKIGGKRWEQKHGRPCLPSIMLHPVKESEPTSNGYETGFELAYG
ncbi:uncharacterized protein J7T54_003951 [Emericellopsis cladophorae]|uniref:Major facilitator superfamily transporter n=1 Tax=Emericellopsis cladophorae TaxID=2686198 RepID=A0A9Q0BEK0_9HYPO|nr:uncharacterized protein J7T54_003951 [Emericellopsis cladophorae]KAI6781685.1 hypothetical protein J7T54_003951 [Emericellopsis cladophorae]